MTDREGCFHRTAAQGGGARAGDRIPLLVVGGPTASGKTGLAAQLAVRLGGEIICADSMQVYRGMEIGTAAPAPEERGEVPHHLFGFLEPSESFSVARYAGLARRTAAEVYGRGRLPVLCGGTGLYIAAVTEGVEYSGAVPENPALRRELRELASREGNGRVWELLKAVDPELAEKLHPNNLGRVIRAIEAHRASGVPMSEWQRRSRERESGFAVCFLALRYRNRELLYSRIDARVGQMLDAGLIAEAKALLEKGCSGTAMQAIGYKELAGYIRGEQSLESAVESLKRQTRRYAKRQLTWLRRLEGVRWLEPDSAGSPEELVQAALEAVEESGILSETPRL